MRKIQEKEIMIYHFLILSDENDDFVREILIDSEATFYDLHEAIMDSVNFDKSQLASFFVSDEEWEKGQEITLMPMDDSTDEALIMEDVRLNEIVGKKKDRLYYQFDFLNDRGFFIELLQLDETKQLAKAKIARAAGDPPSQEDFDDFDLDEMDDFVDDDDIKKFSDDDDDFNFDDDDDVIGGGRYSDDDDDGRYY